MRNSCTRTALATLGLVAMFTVAAPLPAQSNSNIAGGPQTTAKQSPADKETSRRVYDKLTADQVEYYKHVTVTADHGVVTLGGQVASTTALNKAKQIAASVPGVSKVVDQMEVERAPSHQPGH